MAIRNVLLMSVALVSLAACTSDKDKAMDASLDANGNPIAGVDGNNGIPPINGVIPGTQQDLVVNVGDRVFFAYDQSDISEEARATLDRQATWMKQYPNVKITVEGHSDERGTREYNLALGERRANSAKSYLQSQGIEAGRLETISYGKERPAVAESNAAGWAQNRRAVTVVN